MMERAMKAVNGSWSRVSRNGKETLAELGLAR